uniref:Uncharacterized protein n=1 Tax=Caenorhabditis japonica TaxID=281687 RepID=A0A8R1EVL9_CAEJA
MRTRTKMAFCAMGSHANGSATKARNTVAQRVGKDSPGKFQKSDGYHPLARRSPPNSRSSPIGYHFCAKTQFMFF